VGGITTWKNVLPLSSFISPPTLIHHHLHSLHTITAPMSNLLLLPSLPLTTSPNRFHTFSSASPLQFQCRFSLSLLSPPHHPLSPFRSRARTRQPSLRVFDSSSDATTNEELKDVAKEEGVEDQSVGIADQEYPSGEFDFKPVTGWRSFLVKLKMLVAFPWERVRKGSVLTMKLRGQVTVSVLTLLLVGRN